ncbi:HD-GYP domain-containing protein [Oryzibacter oryziterrae]|uniref:HD-GYP domain-containing protein n=1 Tax=Oryzibacter oryziterrae TaxID=2766474 RepID=UPI001F1FD465|nr:HD domain-containing phosphohydrolase [Oryzibacter oryziterrae]
MPKSYHIHVISHRSVAALAIEKILFSYGFQISNHPLDTCHSWSAQSARDINVIVTEDVDEAFLRQINEPHLRQHAARTVIYFSRISPSGYSKIDRMGYRYTASASQRIESLFYLIAQIEPESTHDAARLRAFRSNSFNALFESTVELFQRIRHDLTVINRTLSNEAHEAIENLFAVTPLPFWVETIQNYHDDTAQHCSLVSGISLKFATRLGFSAADRNRIFDAAFFHDVGKARVPLAILDKPGALSPAERTIINRHPVDGYAMLLDRENITQEIAEVAHSHHEYLDGSGYPRGIAGRQINDATRIITICDIFSALIEKRAYKRPKPVDEAYAILKTMDTRLDQDLVRVFEAVAEECAEPLPHLNATASAA